MNHAEETAEELRQIQKRLIQIADRFDSSSWQCECGAVRNHNHEEAKATDQIHAAAGRVGKAIEVADKAARIFVVEMDWHGGDTVYDRGEGMLCTRLCDAWRYTRSEATDLAAQWKSANASVEGARAMEVHDG